MKFGSLSVLKPRCFWRLIFSAWIIHFPLKKANEKNCTILLSMNDISSKGDQVNIYGSFLHNFVWCFHLQINYWVEVATARNKSGQSTFLAQFSFIRNGAILSHEWCFKASVRCGQILYCCSSENVRKFEFSTLQIKNNSPCLNDAKI